MFCNWQSYLFNASNFCFSMTIRRVSKSYRKKKGVSGLAKWKIDNQEGVSDKELGSQKGAQIMKGLIDREKLRMICESFWIESENFQN